MQPCYPKTIYLMLRNIRCRRMGGFSQNYIYKFQIALEAEGKQTIQCSPLTEMQPPSDYTPQRASKRAPSMSGTLLLNPIKMDAAGRRAPQRENITRSSTPIPPAKPNQELFFFLLTTWKINIICIYMNIIITQCFFNEMII